MAYPCKNNAFLRQFPDLCFQVTPGSKDLPLSFFSSLFNESKELPLTRFHIRLLGRCTGEFRNGIFLILVAALKPFFCIGLHPAQGAFLCHVHF